MGNKFEKISQKITVGSEGIFKSPYEQYAKYNGKPFSVIRVIDKDDETHDISDVGTMYEIQFKDKSIIEAWPEELANLKIKIPAKENLAR